MRTTRHRRPAELGTILSVWAHPDDESYLAAGVMAAARDHGQRVVCVSATAGEHGTDDPAAWPPERLGRVRCWEATAAMAVLGVTEHHVLGYRDGELRGDDESAVRRIVAFIDEVDPDTILTFGPDGMTFHPDHIAVHHWVREAWTRRGADARLLLATTTHDHIARYRQAYEDWGIYMTDERPAGVPTERLAVHHRLTGAELDRKLTALRAMATQTAGIVAHLGPDEYAEQNGEENFIDAPRPGEPRWRLLATSTDLSEARR